MGAGEGPILVVEDDPSIRQLLVDTLEQDGFDVVGAADGEEAIAAAEGRRPAVVILDIGLPLMDGPSVADGIRERHGNDVPFIVVTASHGIEKAASRIGAARYLAKPFDVSDLMNAVRQAAQSAMPRGEAEAPPDTSIGPATAQAT